MLPLSLSLSFLKLEKSNSGTGGVAGDRGEDEVAVGDVDEGDAGGDGGVEGDVDDDDDGGAHPLLDGGVPPPPDDPLRPPLRALEGDAVK